MKLICYDLRHDTQAPVNIRPAAVQRDWMDNTPEKFAYRCLPLDIANMHGWEIYCTRTFQAIWNGGNQLTDITVINGDSFATSHFGAGVLTFQIPFLFRTEAGWNLMATGPANYPKPGIQALTGIIEADWAPYTFTMNWIFTEAHRTIEFKEGEPFCFIFPIQRGIVDQVEPEVRNIHSNPELYEQYSKWSRGRYNFNESLKKREPDAVKQKWQRNYYTGKNPAGEEVVQQAQEHQIKIHPKPFKTV